MATYYTSGSSNGIETPVMYSRENLPSSCPESQFLPGNAMFYMNPAVSYSDTVAIASGSVGEGTEGTVSASQERQVLSCFAGSSQIQDFGSWRDHDGSRNGVSLMHSMSGSMSILQTGQGLSLSLGSQILPGVHQMQNQSVPFSCNPNLGAMRDEQSRSNEYVAQVVSGGNHYSGSARTIPNSKYLKAAQQLLDEVVNVRKALKLPQPEGDKNEENSKEGSSIANQDPQESSTNCSAEVSHAERQELQSKLTKLLSMLDEVDRRYKQYYHQMQIVVSSFNVIAGCGAAKPYTALALQTISRHFRCLRDAISGQIVVARKSLGDQDGSDGKGVGISRLRYVDQQLRQQRTLQQLGVMQPHTWRPQRGLPENSVLILRAWLFEHFLHPYPKDSDKIMLARQTGLSRSQVSNWFINARVRLWKPMVEEMYKEEFTDAMENESNSSFENTPKTTKGEEARNPDDHAHDLLHHSITQDQQTVSKDHNNLQTGKGQNHGQGSDVDGCSMFHDPMVREDQMGGEGWFMATASSYNLMEMGRFSGNGSGGGGSGVSLSLGLQNSDGPSVLPMSGGFSGMQGDNIYENATHRSEFEYGNVNTGNRQNRLRSSQMLHDFVS